MGKVDVSRTVDGVETFVIQGFVPTVSNASVTLKTIGFEDFTTSANVTWTFYLYGAPVETHGVRFDDITLTGKRSAAPASRGFYRVRLLPSGQ